MPVKGREVNNGAKSSEKVGKDVWLEFAMLRGETVFSLWLEMEERMGDGYR